MGAQALENSPAGREADLSILNASHGQQFERGEPVTAARTRPPISGRLVVVGGQCRKVGKTALVVDLISAFPEYRWLAVKITPYTELGCPVNGANCGCAEHQHTVAVREENSGSSEHDTGRYLEAGAASAIWVQTKEGRLLEALGPLAAALRKSKSVIIESDVIVNYWQPDLFLSVLDPQNADFKESTRAVMKFADAFVLRSPLAGDAYHPLATIPNSGCPIFLHPLGGALPATLQNFVRQHFADFRHQKAGVQGPSF